MSPSKESYDPHYFEPLFAAEERHFWFVARNKVICSLTKNAISGIKNARILEIGCGTGNVLQALEKNFPDDRIIGMDLFQEGLQLARQRVNCPLIQADLAHPPIDMDFDLVGMFDVLEHIKDDRAVLKQIFQLVKPGGFLLLTVPADPRLWSYFDLASHHVRRYTQIGLRETVLQAGFAEKFISPYIAFTYPLVWLGRKSVDNSIDARKLQVQEQAEKEIQIIPVVNEILRGILGLEAVWLSRGKTLPFGSSLVMLARRPLILP